MLRGPDRHNEGPPEGPRSEREEKSGVGANDEPVLRCSQCASVVARERDRIEVDGAHVHTFVNPSGMEFTVGCFREARGCVAWGEESAFWSWFPGHAWRTALCTACAAHLGWSFRTPAPETPPFYGLILARLA